MKNENEIIEKTLVNDERHIEKEKLMQQIREKVMQSLLEYNKTISYLSSDAPIASLCLPKKTEKILLNSGYLRVYDLFNCDFTKIEGLNASSIGDLTARLNQFVPVF